MDPLDVTSDQVLKFLSTKFNEGVKHGTINAARAALALISSENLADDRLISRFVKGCGKQRPNKPKYDSTWDVDPVLRKLATWYPLDSLGLKELSHKLVVLLALGTAHRLQTLALIKLENISRTTEGLEIQITERIKNSKKLKVQPTLRLPFFNERPDLCIAKTLSHYVERTRLIRNNEYY